jgi:hypothetical protein
MKSFKEYYVEGKQVGTLYHYTTFRNLIRIIDVDRLGNDGKPGTKFVSFTRDKHFDKHQRVGIYPEARFVVDGDRLAHNYKIRPLNWFDNKSEHRPHTGTYDEQEEQVAGPVNYFSRYVIKVQILKRVLESEFEHSANPSWTNSYELRGRVLVFNMKQFLDYIKKYYEVELI